ncbi:MAG: MBG domain-containing protein [Pseudomonadota bacterium]
MRDLLGFAENAAYTFTLTGSIDLTSASGWFIPYLAADFNGGGFTVSNLSLNQSSAPELGMFGRIAAGSAVSNLTLANASVTGSSNVGALAGWNEGVIDNSFVSGANVGGGSNVGGLAGYNAGDIQNSYASGGTVAGASSVGGLVGVNANTIGASHVSGGDVSGSTGVGGLVGNNDYGLISNSFVDTGTVVNGVNSVGGLVGYDSGEGILQSNTVTDTTVNGSTYVGGLAGYFGSAITSTGYIDDNHVVNSFVNGGVVLGGLVGWNGGSISDSYVSGTDVTSSASSTPANVGGLVGYNSGSISSSFVSGGSVTTSGAWNIGGLVGYNGGNISDTYVSNAAVTGSIVGGLVGFNLGSVSNSYVGGGSLSSVGLVGGVVGSNDPGGVVSGTYWNTALIGATNGIGDDGGGGPSDVGAAGLTTGQMMTMSSFTGWNIANTGGAGMIWRIYEGHTGPLLTSFLTQATVSANNATKTYDGAAYSGGNGVSASVAATNGGALFEGTYGGTSQGAVNAGSYTLSVSGAYSDQLGYDIIGYTNGALTVDPATLTLNAVTDTKVYDGTTSSAGVVNAVGLVSGDTISGATQSFGSRNVLGANGSTLAANNTGYTISDGNGGNNYTVVIGSSASGTITPAAMTVTANDLSKYEGTSDPALTYSVGGLQTGDTAVSTLSGTLVRDPGELLGDYAINQGSVGLTTNNYTMTFAPGTFSIVDVPPITPPILSELVLSILIADGNKGSAQEEDEEKDEGGGAVFEEARSNTGGQGGSLPVCR